jgi:hypothetical protein
MGTALVSFPKNVIHSLCMHTLNVEVRQLIARLLDCFVVFFSFSCTLSLEVDNPSYSVGGKHIDYGKLDGALPSILQWEEGGTLLRIH